MKNYFEINNNIIPFQEISWLGVNYITVKTTTNGDSNFFTIVKEEMAQLKEDYKAWLDREDEIQQLTLENLKMMQATGKHPVTP